MPFVSVFFGEQSRPCCFSRTREKLSKRPARGARADRRTSMSFFLISPVSMRPLLYSSPICFSSSSSCASRGGQEGVRRGSEEHLSVESRRP
eukprot:766174-Prorocentrum_minimum.AAC.1